MAIQVNKVEIQDENGNVYYPHTNADVVFTEDGRTVPEYVRQTAGGPGLLINGNFRNPVNQRRKTSYAQEGYTIDQWYLSYDGEGKLEVGPDGVVLSFKTRHAQIMQKLERKLENKQYTFVVEGGGTWVSLTFNPQEPGTKYFFGKDITLYYYPELNGVAIEVGPGEKTVELKSACLMEGAEAVRFIPRHYGEELALCQRYYLPPAADLGSSGYSMMTHYTNSIAGSILFPVTMRVRPNIQKITLRSNEDGSIGHIASFHIQSDVNGINAIFDLTFQEEYKLKPGVWYCVSFEALAELA